MNLKITIDAICSRIKPFVASHPFLIAVYVFGSVATGRTQSTSDLDIAVMSTCRINGFDRIDMETELSNIMGMDVDLVIFRQADILLQHQILKYGILIYETDPEERVRQETASRREYLDTRFRFGKCEV